jgi:hypothetical protein
MAKQYIVKTTIHGMVKKGGEKVVIKRSTEPQNVPDALVKELLASGVIDEVGGAPAEGEGDGASGD